MLKRCSVFVLGTLVLVGNASAANTCYPISGRSDTQSMADQIHQVGVTRLEIGDAKLTGGISGTIVNYLDQSHVVLNHDIGFPGKGSIVTNGDQATITGMIDACRLAVTEIINYKYGTGVFANASMTATATGSLNICNGQNVFKINGKICFANGSAPSAFNSKDD
jgi:uncharacterized membrane protein